MPVFNLLQHLPVPSLKNYVIFSSFLLAAAAYWSYLTVSSSESWQSDFTAKMDEVGLSPTTKSWFHESTFFRMLYFLLSDQFSLWVVVNTACCALFVTGKIVQLFVFGRLRGAEQQLMRDRLWNFVFYKFIFVFGVLNVNYLDELLLWLIWFAMVGFFQLLASLAQDRFRHVTAAPVTGSSVHIRILTLLGVILFSSTVLLVVAAVVSHKISMNYGFFLAAESISLFFRSLYGVVRYSLHWYSARQDANWERSNSVAYYTDVIFELLILITDFVHHLHMLIWSNIFLSMASLVICMQLRNLYNEIDRRLKRHRNFQRVSRFIAEK